MITQQRLKEVLSYDPETGDFRWRVTRGRSAAGCIAGCIYRKVYVTIKIDGVMHQAHRLAWLYQTGRLPAGEIDHEDRDGTNNRFLNLREASRSQNGANRGVHRNNKVGIKGVKLMPGNLSKPYSARIQVNGRGIHLGVFPTAEQAGAAYQAAAKQYYGEFAA
mgnify:CR=1 FL=1